MQWRQVFARCFVAGILVLGVISVSGCATSLRRVSGVDSYSQDLTQSDESEARRRAQIRLQLAANYFESGQTTVALDEVNKSLVTDPTYADAYNLRGLIYMRLSDYSKAENNFLQALSIDSQGSGILHNYAWLLCQEKKYTEADKYFDRVLTSPNYAARSKTLMAQGLCRARAGDNEQAEKSLVKAYEMDASNPIVAYNLASLLLQRKELIRAQFYIRRLNNSDLANAESLWLGIKVEYALGDSIALRQLGSQLKRRFGDSPEQILYDRGNFNE